MRFPKTDRSRFRKRCRFFQTTRGRHRTRRSPTQSKTALRSMSQCRSSAPLAGTSGCARWQDAERVDGRTKRLTGAFQDVTERYVTQARLARTIRGHAGRSLGTGSSTGQVWVSPRFRELLSYDEETFPKETGPFSALLHPDDGRRSPRHPRLTSPRTRRSISKYDCEPRTGLYRWVRVRAAAELDSERSACHAFRLDSGCLRPRAAAEAACRRLEDQERVSREHESRDPHADERCARHD